MHYRWFYFISLFTRYLSRIYYIYKKWWKLYSRTFSYLVRGNIIIFFVCETYIINKSQLGNENKNVSLNLLSNLNSVRSCLTLFGAYRHTPAWPLKLQFWHKVILLHKSNLLPFIYIFCLTRTTYRQNQIDRVNLSLIWDYFQTQSDKKFCGSKKKKKKKVCRSQSE